MSVKSEMRVIIAKQLAKYTEQRKEVEAEIVRQARAGKNSQIFQDLVDKAKNLMEMEKVTFSELLKYAEVVK